MSFDSYFGICNIILSGPYDSFILYKFNVKMILTFMFSNLQNYSGANYSENSFNFT